MVPSCFMFVFCYISAHPLNLHSFPTRRSSDLRMRSREGRLGKWSLLDEEILRPIVDEDGSDSAMLDNVAELLTREGQFADESRDVRQAVAMLVPAAWEGAVDMPEARRAFHRYHASVMEPWDGPAALVFTDGRRVGALLD